MLALCVGYSLRTGHTIRYTRGDDGSYQIWDEVYGRSDVEEKGHYSQGIFSSGGLRGVEI